MMSGLQLRISDDRRPASILNRLIVVPALSALILALFFAVSVTEAHPIVIESSPAHDAVLTHSPEKVTLRFNSKIEKRLTRVTITRSDGRSVPLAVASDASRESTTDRLVIPLRPLPAGTYVVRYKILAADGHVTQGALRFTVNGAM